MLLPGLFLNVNHAETIKELRKNKPNCQQDALDSDNEFAFS